MSLVETEIERPTRAGGWKLAAVGGVMVTALVLGLVLGREWGQFALGALEALPFAVLAILAYLGVERRWARWLAVATLILIVLAFALTALGMTLGAVAPKGFGTPGQTPAFSAEGLRQLALVGGGIAAALLIAATGFIPAVRRLLARFLPLDPTSFVHTTALVLAVAVTLIGVIPLLVLSHPPLLSDTLLRLMEADSSGRDSAGQLLDDVYGLVWLVPAAVIAVGFGIRRNLTESLVRLGFVWPSWRQVAVGLGIAVGLFLAVSGGGKGIEWLWGAMGWPVTDVKAIEGLFAHFNSPLGAVIIGVVAGIGEELAVRGALQPRLGIWLSNLFFTSLHAFQYNWDTLLVVFALGMVLGVLRTKTNTTTCALVHGAYNFLLTMAVVYQVPWFS